MHQRTQGAATVSGSRDVGRVVRRCRGFTLIELLVAVGIIALLLAILLPTLAGSLQVAKRAGCQSNLRQISLAVQMYTNHSDGVLPDAGFYGCGGKVGESLYQAMLGTQDPEETRPLNRYLEQTDVFRCPGDRGDTHVMFRSDNYFRAHGSSYAFASDGVYPGSDSNPIPIPTFGVGSCRLLNLDRVEFLAKKIVFIEPPFSPAFNEFTVDLNGDGIVDNNERAWWHDKSRNHGNVLFADQHVEFVYTLVFDPYAMPDPAVGYY